MSSQLTTITSAQLATITYGPKINDVQFQGWYVHSGGSLEAIDCPSNKNWFTTNSYAECCDIGGAASCSTFWTSCAGNVAVGVRSDTCGSDSTCQTVSIFDQFPINGGLVHSQIICAPSDWSAFSLYRTYQSTTTTTATSAILISASPAQTASQSILTSTTDTAASVSQSTASGSAVPTQIAQNTTSQAWIAGAVVGPVVLIALLVAGIFAFVVLPKKRRRQRQEGTLPAYSMHQVRDPGYNSSDAKAAMDQNTAPSELYVEQASELHGQHSDGMAHELPGDFNTRSK